MKRKLQFSIPMLLALTFLGGCQGGDEDGDQAPNIDLAVEKLCQGVPEEESNCAPFTKDLLTTIRKHSYRSDEYSKIHDNSGFPSSESIGKNVAIYINSESAQEFSQIDPSRDGSFVDVPIGTTIIREIWSDEAIEKFTVMIKMEAGYFPEGGDFSYIEIGTDFDVFTGGTNESCAACHQSRESDGFLFGVSDEYKKNLDEPDNQEPITDPNLETDPVERNLMVLARNAMENQNYLNTEDFVEVNSQAFVSALNSESYINLYVSKFAYEEFIKVDPDTNQAIQVDIPENTVIVRTVSSAEGELQTYTIMVKGPEGYYPNGGNYYYGVFDTDINVDIRDGEAREGPLVECGGCHKATRSTSGFLFGVGQQYKNESGDQTGSNPDIDSTEHQLMLAARNALSNQNYLDTEDFVEVNSQAFVSALNPESYINLYVSKFAYEEFIKVDPDSNQVNQVDIPENTVIVRTVSSAEGELQTYTVMVKGPEGYYPNGGNYYYGVFDTDLNVDITDGERREGALVECGSCHRASRSFSSFLFGVSEQYQDENDDQNDSSPEIDVIEHQLMLAARNALNNQSYLGDDDFSLVNSEPFVSELNSENYIDLFISEFALDEFKKVDPNDNQPLQVDIPENTVIVRSVSSSDGELKNYTLMVKGPEGYFPSGGDFYYGVFDTDANVVLENGVAREGALIECGSCHNTRRSNSGFVFGVSPSIHTPQAQ